ncbi:recombinase family protein [Phreatobacter oligotrophus]|uniref:DNA invertase Pin-like site-specific DNA recombinase n=1 Tax=Phreatobacter oligotrophus TaxID=1122261 RepID=A0A2T4YY55_9HYPH|nr:recombinase family protein [Phreatobacter oligotrophus]PTM51463.1 DNA invertase Pin-like site-specific DNA recombinase [Phreatobacter oligotrophus]
MAKPASTTAKAGAPRAPSAPATKRCAIYTRKSTDEGLDQDFNSLHAQREACEAYIASQRHEGWVLVPTAFDDGGYSGGTTDRPGLQALLAEVDAGKVDVVVVYKVDRLTRSLADFAKIVERFDAHGVSFVSVTQSFNTTTSMGRLTLNVLLSFAQFEREVGAERVRDKIAASKKKGIWMGGVVPLGYRVENRKLLIHEEEAERVRQIFQLYLNTGSLHALVPELRARGIRTALRYKSTGAINGDRDFTLGGLSHLLRNRTYLGELPHKGSWNPGEHEALIEPALFKAVQDRLTLQLNAKRRLRAAKGGLLTGKIFDSTGNRMTPVHAKKNGIRYRYYISRALCEGRTHEAGTRARVPAPDIERLVVDAIQRQFGGGDASPNDAAIVDQDPNAIDLVDVHLDRATVHAEKLVVTVREAAADGACDERANGIEITVPWSPKVLKPQREVHTAKELSDASQRQNQLRLVVAIHRARQWHAGLVSGAFADIDAIATQEQKSPRNIRTLLNLAFLAPDIIEAIIDERLKVDTTVSDLSANLPANWAEQRRYVGMTTSLAI